MLASLKNSLAQGKDSLAAKTLAGLANQRLEGVGSVSDVRIDSSNKSLSARLRLEGESIEMDVAVGRYELVAAESGLAMRLQKVSASRPWAQKLASWFLEDQVIPLPPDIPEAMVRMVL